MHIETLKIFCDIIESGSFSYAASQNFVTQSVVAGSIRVGTVYSVGLHELPPYLTEFLRNYPAVNVHLEYLRSNKIYEDLVEGKIDLGVVAYPAKRSQIVTIAFRHDELVLVVPPDSQLAKHNKVSVGALSGQKFVGYERDT